MARRTTKSIAKSDGPFRIKVKAPDRVGPTKLVPGRVYTVDAETRKQLGENAEEINE